MRPLEALTKVHWEAQQNMPDWDELKRHKPELARQAYEQMRQITRYLAPLICSKADKIWLERVSKEELFF
jgi:hypothetical protein